MPLKITDTTPGNLNKLNQWAVDKEAALTNHTQQIAQQAASISALQKQIETLTKKA